MVYNYILYYLLIGVVNTIIIDYFVNKIAELHDKDTLTNLERIWLLALWPIYSFAFWYNFAKAFFKDND